jgi:hypothetical protein
VAPDGTLSFSPESLQSLFADHAGVKLNLLDVITVDAGKTRDMNVSLGDAVLPLQGTAL